MRAGQPRVRDNDWSALDVPDVGDWEPTLSVSLVVPAHNPRRLDLVLAALAAQSYPAHLTEVLVVDDGSEPTVDLPELRPENTRVLSLSSGWGRAAACQLGADESEGQVIHWLDSDMVTSCHEVEAQMRWHHVIDYAVVLGHKMFVPLDALDRIAPAELRDTLLSGRPPESLSDEVAEPHAWVEPILEATSGLCTAGPRAMRVHVGASASVTRELFETAGGMPTDLKLGEDIVLGYRLREAGAVFVPDRESRSLHLGPTSVMQWQDEVNRYNKPFFTDLVPEFRAFRVATPRSYAVPYVEAVLPVGGGDYETVLGAVHALLSGNVPDLVVTLVADWSALPDGRRSVLADPHLDLRLLRGAFRSEPRVMLLDRAPEVCPATFRLCLPGPATYPVGNGLRNLLHTMETEHVGCQRIELADGTEARIERTAAVARARRVAGDDPLDEVLREVGASQVLRGADGGFVAAPDAPAIKRVRGLAPWGATNR